MNPTDRPPDPFGTPSGKELFIRRAAGTEGTNFVFTGASRRANMLKSRARRLTFEAVESQVPKEPPTKSTNWAWRPRTLRKFKFVDDGTFVSKLNMAVGFDQGFDRGSGPRREKRDQATENVFRRTISRATALGMKVNVQKTVMLTISASQSYIHP